MVRLSALDSRELICRFAKAGIAVFAHNYDLEVRRRPHLGSNFDGRGITDLSCRNRSRDSLAIDGNTLHHLRAARFRHGFIRLTPARPLPFMPHLPLASPFTTP